MFEPAGLRFFDFASGREMILVEGGEWDDWVCYRHPDGQWVSLRKATDEDRRCFAQALIETATLRIQNLGS